MAKREYIHGSDYSAQVRALDRIAAILKARGQKKKWFCEQMGWHPTQMNMRFERRFRMSDEDRMKAAEVVGANVNDLFCL